MSRRLGTILLGTLTVCLCTTTTRADHHEGAGELQKVIGEAAEALSSGDEKTVQNLIAPPNMEEDRKELLGTLLDQAKSTEVTIRDGQQIVVYNFSEKPEDGGYLVFVKVPEKTWVLLDYGRGQARDPMQAVTERESKNELKYVGLAMHNYHDTYGHFPQNITDDNGKPLLSWRVAILPYMDQYALYDQFNLDEPWDSANNKPLIAKLEKTYDIDEQGRTAITTPVMKGAMLMDPERKQTTGFRDVLDGTSNTIMTVRAGEPLVIWSKPEDITVDPKQPLKNFKFTGNKMTVGLGDGSVMILSTEGSPETYLNLFNRADGNWTDAWDLRVDRDRRGGFGFGSEGKSAVEMAVPVEVDAAEAVEEDRAVPKVEMKEDRLEELPEAVEDGGKSVRPVPIRPDSAKSTKKRPETAEERKARQEAEIRDKAAIIERMEQLDRERREKKRREKEKKDKAGLEPTPSP